MGSSVMFPINHPHVSDGERAKNRWGRVGTGWLHGFQLVAGAVMWMAYNQDSTSLSVSVQLSWVFLGVRVHRVMNCHSLTQPSRDHHTVDLCESLKRGFSRILLEHGFVSRQSQKLRAEANDLGWLLNLLYSLQSRQMWKQVWKQLPYVPEFSLIIQLRGRGDGGQRRFSLLRAVSWQSEA